jgi:hypothetical protein
MNVTALTRPSRVHLRDGAKFIGLAGSSWPSQPTMPRSRSISGCTVRVEGSRLTEVVVGVFSRSAGGPDSAGALFSIRSSEASRLRLGRRVLCEAMADELSFLIFLVSLFPFF